MSALLVTAVCLSTLLALHGLRKRSLSASGAAAAFCVGIAHLSCGLRFGLTLVAFYLTSSKLTKWRGELKRRLEAGHVEGGARSAAQVLANSLGGAALALGSWWLVHGAGPAGPGPAIHTGASAPALLSAAFVGFYACCCADTWSSEVGIAAKVPPRLITTGKVVPPGTNGGVSLLGMAAALCGGLLVGAVFWLCQLADTALGLLPCAPAACTLDAALLFPLAASAGVLGSLLDSLLGATLQYSGFDRRSHKATSVPPRGPAEAQWVHRTCGRDVLSNTQVNIVSSLLTSLAAAVAVHAWYGGLGGPLGWGERFLVATTLQSA